METAPQVFTFAIDANYHKLVAVRQNDRTAEVNVRLARDVVIDDQIAEIRNAIDPRPADR